MTFVAINLLTVPAGEGDRLEERFRGRAGAVDRATGFINFELLRPVSGTDQYMVLTHWRSAEDFEAWTKSQSFRQGHASATGRKPERPSSATGSEIMTFEVAQSSSGRSDADT